MGKRTAPQPPSSEFSGEELDAYKNVVARQTAYDYPTFVTIFPAKHRALLDGMLLPEVDGLPTSERVQAYMGAMLHAPLVMNVVSEMGVHLRNAGARGDGYQNRDREWVDMVLGVELGCWSVVYAHFLDGLAGGMKIEHLRAVIDGRDFDLPRDELIKATYIRQVARGTVEDGSYEAVVGLFGVRGAIEFTQFITFLIMTIRNIQALDAQPGFDKSMVEDLIGMAERGEVEIPDKDARIPSRIAAKQAG